MSLSRQTALTLVASILTLCAAAGATERTTARPRLASTETPAPAPANARSRAAGPGKASLEVSPSRIVMTDPREVRRILVTARQADGSTVDRSGTAKLAVSGDAIRVDGERAIHPVRDGAGAVEVSSDGMTARVEIEVHGLGEARPVGFVRDVMPVLAKAGCNSGACHGGAKGKNGFKLSLRGYDPKFDYAALVDDLAGRRFNRADPAQSLMLLKPTMVIAHGGGQRFTEGSRYYRILLEWIRGGVRLDDLATGAVAAIEVLPAEIMMARSGLSQQMLVVARYPDRSERDVTTDAHFVSAAPTVADVTESGLVKGLRTGESSIQVRYQGQYVRVPVTVITEREGFQWTALPQYNAIDRLVDAKLRRLKILPSEVASDGDFMRRVSLDLTGLLPRSEDVRAFLADPTETHAKRAAWIERLLASEEYVDHWALKWGDLLLSNRRFLGEKGVWAYRNWIRRSIAENKPYDRFVREIVTSAGSTYRNPPSNFFRATRDPKVMMETVSQVFLGVRMMCANCHDHPFEPWTQRSYYEMTAFFSGVALKEGPQGDDEVVYEKRRDDEVRHPKYGHVLPARFPFAEPPGFDAGQKRREQFAAWLTAKDNPYFAPAIANRIWSYFFGRGIIEPVDDLRPSNPPSNPALVEALANDLRRSAFDLKQLMRRITNSRVYQTSYRTNVWNEGDETNFSHQRPRRLQAEQLLDAVARATGSRLKFEGLPDGFRAEQLPDSRVGAGGFLDLFGRPARESSCECERRGDVSLAQALSLVNGPVVADAVADPEGRVARLVLARASDSRIVDELYLATLSRPPDAAEAKRGVEYLRGGPEPANARSGAAGPAAKGRAERAQDLLWALVNSHGFLFNR